MVSIPTLMISLSDEEILITITNDNNNGYFSIYTIYSIYTDI